MIAAPVPASPVGLVRIVIGAAALVLGLADVPLLVALTRATTLRVPWAVWLPAPTPARVGLLLALWFASATAFALGWRTRLAGAVLTFTLAAVLALDQQSYSNHLYLMTLLVGLLTVGDAGAAR